MEASPPPKAGNPAERVMHAFWQLKRAIRRHLSPALEQEWGIELKHYLTLSTVRGGRQSPTALAEALSVPPSEVSRLLSALEERGLVRRELDPDDLRRMRLTVTPQGEKVLDGVHRTLLQLFERGLAPLPPARVEKMADALLHIAEAMGRDGD